MRVLINALSATNLSGRAVLRAHLDPLARWTRGAHEFVLLHHAGNRDLCEGWPDNVHSIEAPPWTAGWRGRAFWERLRLKATARDAGADLVLMLSGATAQGVDVPQAVLAMNPWCFVPQAQCGAGQRLKARLQRRAYRRAVARAAHIFYLSDYLRKAYRENAGRRERAGDVVYVPLAADVLATAAGASEGPAGAGAVGARRRGGILCVSAMLPHKGVETVVEAVGLIRRQRGVGATLTLVGGWPDPAYERRIRALVAARGLQEAVLFEGHVPRDALLRRYAEARVFCLMSRCESFGIPLSEAQALGTPVVCSDCCALPEVCGEGALYAAPDDPARTADALGRLLTDDAAWQALSDAARRNARRFTPERCTRPFLALFEGRAPDGRSAGDASSERMGTGAEGPPDGIGEGPRRRAR